jgi:hypothetical protein
LTNIPKKYEESGDPQSSGGLQTKVNKTKARLRQRLFLKKTNLLSFEKNKSRYRNI